MSILDGLFKIGGNISGWFTPERRDKSKREKRKKLERKIKDLKNKECTPEIAKKVRAYEKKLQILNDSIGA